MDQLTQDHIDNSNTLITEIQNYCQENPAGNDLTIFWDNMEQSINNFVTLLIPFFSKEHRIENQDLFDAILPLCIRGNFFDCDKSLMIISRGFYGHIIHFIQEYVLFNKLLQIQKYVDIFNRTTTNYITYFHNELLRLENEYNSLQNSLPTANNKTPIQSRMKVIKRETKNLKRQKSTLRDNLETQWLSILSVTNDTSVLNNEVESKLTEIIRNGRTIHQILNGEGHVPIETLENNISKLDNIILVLNRIIFLREIDSFCKNQSIPENVRRGRVPPTTEEQEKINITNEHSKFITRLTEYLRSAEGKRHFLNGQLNRLRQST